MKGQVNMADEANFAAQFIQLFWSIHCATCNRALSWRTIRPILFTNAGCRHGRFQCISSICWANFWAVMVSPGFRSYSESDGHQTTKQWSWPVLGASLALRSKCLKLLVWPNHWPGHHWLLYKIHFLSHVKIWLRHGSLFLDRIKEDTLQKDRFFGLWSAHEALMKIFHLSNLLQMPNNHRMVMLSSLATSYAVVRGSASKTDLSWSLSSSHGQPLHSSSSGLFSPLQNLLNFHYTVQLLEVPGPNALLTLWVV